MASSEITLRIRLTIPRPVVDYCDEHGYTEPQIVNGQWWAYPPGGVMRVPLEASLPIFGVETWAEIYKGAQQLGVSMTLVAGVLKTRMEALSDEYWEIARMQAFPRPIFVQTVPDQLRSLLQQLEGEHG